MQMKNCTYTTNTGLLIKNYLELYDRLKNNIQDINDILYSKDIAILSRIIDLLELIKKDNIVRFSTEFRVINEDDAINVNGCSEINVDDQKYYTLLSFINSGKFTHSDGTHIIRELRIEDYIDRMKLLYSSKGIELDEIESKILFIQNNWKKISKDGGDLHKIILKYQPYFESFDIDKLTKNTAFDSEIIPDIENQVMKLVFLLNRIVSKELGDIGETKIIKNINITSPIVNDDKLIKAHIDYIVIRPDGTLEIFNIKSSYESPAFWDRAKVETYMNECALINRILLANGISTKNIRFNIIPAILKYNDNFTRVLDVDIQPAICYSHKGGKFILQEAFNNVANFIEVVESKFEISDQVIEETNKLLEVCFPENGIKAKGIHITAEEYLDKNWNYLVTKNTDEGYILTINDIDYEIKDLNKGSKNKQAVELIKTYHQDLLNSGDLSVSSILNQLKHSRRNGYVALNDSYLESVFQPYFKYTEVVVNGEKKLKYEWILEDNQSLAECGIIMFTHSITKQTNLIVVSAMSLDTIHKINGNNTVLGAHVLDTSVDIQGKKLMKSTYGNIEIMRALFLLNNLLPTLENDRLLGDITVVGNLGLGTKGKTEPIQLVLPNFIKAVQILKLNKVSIENNFKSIKHISSVDLLINLFYNILSETPTLRKTALGELKNLIGGSEEDAKQHLINGLVIDSLASAESLEILILRLEEFISKLEEILKSNNFTDLSPNSLINKANSPYSESKLPLINACCKLLILASITLDRLSGVISILESDLSTEDKYWLRPLNLANDLVRMVGSLLLKAIQNTLSRLESKINDFNKACLEYYKAKGYSKINNAIIGNQSYIFSHLYQPIDDELFFKNPFDMSNDLKDVDRKFLKTVLLTINLVRDPNINNLESYIESHPNSLWVPLEEASESTKYSNLSEHFQQFKERCGRYCTNPSLLFKELYEGILTEDLEKTLRQDIENLLAYNKFRRSENQKGRFKLLSKYKKSFFETNILNLVIDYINAGILEDEMNKMLVRTKGILLYLKLSGISNINSDKQYEDAILYINNYLKTSVYGVSIINDDLKRYVAIIQPLRKLISKVYIAVNPSGAVRDTIGGFLSNTIRAATKYKTDVSVSDILWAYKYIIGKGVHSAMDVDLLDKFNTKYLISNINLESPQEGYKTNRGGITNISNLMYATLRKPDYLNRMVLFIAKLKKDGAIDAYSVQDGILKYNWKLDKRFNLLVENDKSNIEEYNKQKSLYLSLIIKYNEENPNNRVPVSITTNLPEGYTISQIEVIKHLSDSIYGSYSLSTKAAYEHMALGSQLGVFSTWMNGIYDAYLGTRRISQYETKLEQAYDENGNLLYITDDGIITTEVTDQPYMKDVPLMVQGVFKTVGDTIKMLYKGNFKNLKEVYLYMKSDPMQARNWRRLFTDLLFLAIIKILFELLFDPAYKKHKKEGDGNDVLINAMLELLYKGGSSCYEEFRGPLPIFDYVTTNIKPASWLLGSNILLDSWNYAFGDKTTSDIIFKYSALPRSFQDTYKMYQRENKVNLQK